MSTEFNDKGKYFTNVISKVAIPAIIQTVIQRVEGYIHVRPGERVKSELDHSEAFLAVTDARVFAADGSVLYQAAFMSIARSQIVWVIPSDANPLASEQ